MRRLFLLYFLIQRWSAFLEWFSTYNDSDPVYDNNSHSLNYSYSSGRK